MLFFTQKPRTKQLTPEKKVQTKLMAVLCFAEWCENSEVMVAAFKNLKNRFDGRGVLFVTLDMTNNTSKYQADLLTSALALEENLKEHKGTGFILLIDAETRTVLGKLTVKLTFAEMVTVMAKFLVDIETRIKEALAKSKNNRKK